MSKYLWRVGRKLYLYARGELHSSQKNNGEFYLLQKIIPKLEVGKNIFIDIGANTGIWIDRAKSICTKEKIDIFFYIIEPSSSAFDYLKTFYGGFARCFKLALGDERGVATLNIYGENYGINSLYEINDQKIIDSERIDVDTFDNFRIQNQISEVCYVKSDTEGNCFNVLQGASNAFNAGAIKFWQFEYNYRWLYSGASLLKVFDWIKGKPYQLGKISREKIYVYKKWHFELDRFFETNFILIRNDCLHMLDEVIVYCDFDLHNAPIKINDINKLGPR